MFETLNAMPIAFWVVILLLGAGFYWSARNVPRAIGIPTSAVLVTVAVWYVGDALYNDYLGWHLIIFDSWVLTQAWWQVALFLGSFLLLTPYLHQKINRRYLRRPSQVIGFYRRGVNHAGFQRGLTIIFWFAFGLWILLLAFAAWNFGDRFFSYLCPYLGKHPGPWVTSGKAGGALDSLLALAGYFQIMIGAVFGVVAALSTNRNVRLLALIGIIFTWPYFVFDRTRKSIMALVVPALLAWVFLRFRASLWMKAAVVIAGFLLVNAWFGFVIGNRGESAISDAFSREGFNFTKASKEKHQGLNMFEELCWVSRLTADGVFEPNWGGNYLANLANPVPRMLWPGKPTIGLDYAIARGMGGANTEAGVYATLSTGLIGQGVANFGLYLGAPFAALLMALWASWLARLDLLGQRIGFIPLYGLGLIITFALGRDITFLDLYPFVFGFGLCWWLNRNFGSHPMGAKRATRKNQHRSKRQLERATSPDQICPLISPHTQSET
jgi:hypothetical protein